MDQGTSPPQGLSGSGPAGWPPPGAELRRVAIEERAPGAPGPAFEIREGGALEALHRAALVWLLEEHPRSRDPAPGGGHAVLEIARTPLPGGRVGHRYALDGGPLGAPAAEAARGVLWRFLHQDGVRA